MYFYPLILFSWYAEAKRGTVLYLIVQLFLFASKYTYLQKQNENELLSAYLFFVRE